MFALNLPCRRAAHACTTTLLAAALAGCGAAAEPPRSAEAVAAETESPPPNPSERPAPSTPGSPLLDFLRIGRGDRIADLGAGKGYSVREFSSAVGPFGVVYVRHDPRVLHGLASDAERADPSERVPDNVLQMATPRDAPFTAQAKNLDAALLLFGYHELVSEGRDRRQFNAAVLRALKPGGWYFVAEHAVPPGADRTPDRVAPSLVRAEVEAAGFRFVEAADFLSSALVERASAARREPQTSQYILKFQKPASR